MSRRIALAAALSVLGAAGVFFALRRAPSEPRGARERAAAAEAVVRDRPEEGSRASTAGARRAPSPRIDAERSGVLLASADAKPHRPSLVEGRMPALPPPPRSSNVANPVVRGELEARSDRAPALNQRLESRIADLRAKLAAAQGAARQPLEEQISILEKNLAARRRVQSAAAPVVPERAGAKAPPD